MPLKGTSTYDHPGQRHTFESILNVPCCARSQPPESGTAGAFRYLSTLASVVSPLRGPPLSVSPSVFGGNDPTSHTPCCPTVSRPLLLPTFFAMTHSNQHDSHSTDPAGAFIQPYVYLTSKPAAPGASRLVSLSYLGFASLRAYRDREGFTWFVLADVFKALGLPGGTSGMRKRITDPEDFCKVRVWVANTVNPEASGFRMLQVLREGGMHAMLGGRTQDASISLRKWLAATAAPILRTV